MGAKMIQKNIGSDTQSKDSNDSFSKQSSPEKDFDQNSAIDSESCSSSCSSMTESKSSITIEKPIKTVSQFQNDWLLEQYDYTKATTDNET